MTVSYSRLVANGSSFGCFWGILRKWRGSVYKLVWRELIVYLLFYFAINLTYRYAMTEQQQRIFEKMKLYLNVGKSNIPMAFVLGFYVQLVVKRWWEQYRLLPWPDTLALFVSAAIPGADERVRVMRRTIVRYAVLAYVITLKHVSVRVKKRFPTLQHIVDAGFMMESEKKIVEMMDERSPMAKYWMPLVWATNVINRARKESLISSDQIVQTLLVELSEIRRRLGGVISYDTVCVPLVYTQMIITLITGLMMESEKKIFDLMERKTPMTKYWLPLTWATNIMNRARKDSLITSDHMVQTILLEMSDLRMRLGSLIGYDNVNIPIVYTQVVTLSVYSYFLAALIGTQMIPRPVDDQTSPSDAYDPDLYFPFLTVLEFFFYIGWLKVAEVLIGPFGEDDDDIELNWLIDRHIKAAYMIVDEMHEEHPELLKDQYWDEVVPKDLPYTVASEHYRREEPKGSAEFYKVKESDALYANVNPSRRKSVIPDDVYADYESVDTPVAERRKNWFQRQITRMGSLRSSTTTYSSGGLFGRTRHNSVYSSPENGIPITVLTETNNTNVSSHKMSLYDRIVGRKSTRGNSRSSRQGSNKMNGNIPSTLKNRPRIPTPDVAKDAGEMEAKHNQINSIYHTHNMSPSSVGYATELPVVQVVLSPIQELESISGNTSSSGASALAQAVLTPALTSVGLKNNISLNTVAVSPVALSAVSSMSQPFLSSLGITTKNSQAAINDSMDGRASPSTSVSSSAEEASRKTSLTSHSKRGEVYV